MNSIVIDKPIGGFIPTFWRLKKSLATGSRRLFGFVVMAFAVHFAAAAIPVGSEKLQWTLTSESTEEAGFRVLNAGRVSENPGDLLRPVSRSNKASLEFDGSSSIVLGPRSDTEGLATNFTWEGYFLLLSTETVPGGSGISRRLITQFSDETGNSPRLTIGLVGSGKKQARLGVLFDGTDDRIQNDRAPTKQAVDRLFGYGSIDIARDTWHHFALVYDGTADAGTITWYLDRQPCGILYLGNEQNPNRLRPPGTAPFAVGGARVEKGAVKFGFKGYLDEIKLSGRALSPNEFLVEREPAIERDVEFTFYESVEPTSFRWDFEKRQPSEVIRYEGLAFDRLPPFFGYSGFLAPRHGYVAVRGETAVSLAPGRYRLLLRAPSQAMVTIDGMVVVDARNRTTEKPNDQVNGFEADYDSRGRSHRISVAAILDGSNASQEQELVVAYAPAGTSEWRLIGTRTDTEFKSRSWAAYKARSLRYVESLGDGRRKMAIDRGKEFWRRRHEAARQVAAAWPAEEPKIPGHSVDAMLNGSNRPTPLPGISDAAFLRRVSLDVRGRIPAREEVQAFLSDTNPDKRTQLVDKFLASDEWADGWMGFWQDALAESPSLVYASLGNSGPFRKFLYETFRANVPVDRFVTDLVLMDGNDREGGAGGFSLAFGNDTPPAMKAHVVLKTFLAADLKCAKCHDSPIDTFTQTDLFSIAAFLNDGPMKISETNVAATQARADGHKPMVETSLKPGDMVAPEWTMADLTSDEKPPREMIVQPGRPRAELAAWITWPSSSRFSEVMMERLWNRYFGVTGNLDQLSRAHRTKVIGYLAKRFVMEGYDLKAMARLLLTSAAYAAAPRRADAGSAPWYQPEIRRLSAEQLVDSLFFAVGKRFDGEVLGFGSPALGAVDLPRPERAWQFTGLSNERDRPALGMPVNQTIMDALTTFGLPLLRVQPQLERDNIITALQPMLLFNGLLSQRIVRLSDLSAITELCLQDTSPRQVVEQLFLAVLSRPPTERERSAFTEILTPGFAERCTGRPKAQVRPLATFQPNWKVHLFPEQTSLGVEAQKRVARGEPPTDRLTPEFRERVEDLLWALINSPEFMFVL